MKLTITITLLILNFNLLTAQKIDVRIYPETTTSIEGHSVLDRSKYFNISHNGLSFESAIKNTEISYRYINDLKMCFGRSLGLVQPANIYTKNLREDQNRPGYVDLTYLQNNSKPSNGVSYSAIFRSRFPKGPGTLNHEHKNAFPVFMEKEAYSGTTDSIPKNKVAAAEIVANLLKFNFTDWSRPLSYEPINEPTWQFLESSMMLSNLADFHIKTWEKVKEMQIPTMVGGPCSPVSYYYRDNYSNFSKLAGFIDATQGKLDFYSFHVYDFYRWNSSLKKLGGRITSGLPLEGVMDLYSNYGRNKYNKEFLFLSTEHGGTLNVAVQKKAMQEYFLGMGEGFAYDMKAKSITDFLMVNSCISNTLVFMNRPHQVYKVVPFILLESTGWDPKYHASILVANNYTDKTKWFESAQIHFYEYFKDVKGRRVLSQCPIPDIQLQSYVDNNKLIILMNNLSDSVLNLTLSYPVENIDSTIIRRLYRNSDFTPVFTESKIEDGRNLALTAKESVVLFINYNQIITEKTRIDEKTFFADKYMRQFNSEETFKLNIDDINDVEYASLRIGLGRGVGTNRNFDLWFNGRKVAVPMEKCASNLEDDNTYGTTKIVQIDKSFLKSNNDIKIAFADGKSGGIGSIALSVGKKVTPSGITNVSSECAKIEKIYPNHADSGINVSFTLNNPSITNLKVYSSSGKVVKSNNIGQLHPGNYNYPISLTDLAKGIYILQLQANSNQYNQKIVIN